MKYCKHVLIAMLVFVVLFVASGCGASSAAEPAVDKGEGLVVSSDFVGFEEVASFEDNRVTYIYYRCQTTNVMYVCRERRGLNGYSYGGFTAMLDPKTNGPLTYENWLAYLESTADNN